MLLRTPGGRPSAGRPGTAIVLVAILMTLLVGMVAFAVDVGWMVTVRAQLQTAADSAAMAGAANLYGGNATATNVAKTIGGANVTGGSSPITIADSDVVIGYWNATTRTFTAGGTPTNAVQVTARQTTSLFFGGVFGRSQADIGATAIAAITPRDIAFVVDLSGSMNNDSEIWATAAIDAEFSSYGTVGSDLMQNVFTDFNFGTYPGTLRFIGDVPGANPSTAANPKGRNSYQWLINTYLMQSTIPTTYRVLSTDSAATKKTKAYSWLIVNQLAPLMPNAKPALTTANLAYWSDYLDYVIDASGFTAPASQDTYRMTTQGANPYADAWPDLTSTAISGFANKVGYQTYVQFMMDYGWNKRAGTGTYAPISRLSLDCPWRLDNDPASPGYGLSFPPREQPTHALRLAVMAGINRVKTVNTGLPDSLKDHVCVITFDTGGGTTIRYPLSATSIDYDAAKSSVRDMQAVADDALSTASENGLILARQHLDPAVNPSGARPAARKLLIFVTDGIPNIKQTTNTAIDTYKGSNTKVEWFTSGSYSYERNAVLMQTAQLQGMGWTVYNMGVGLGCDLSMMDRMARSAGTAIQDPANPTGPKVSPRAGGNPADYQARMTSILNTILASPLIQLVK